MRVSTTTQSLDTIFSVTHGQRAVAPAEQPDLATTVATQRLQPHDRANAILLSRALISCLASAGEQGNVKWSILPHVADHSADLQQGVVRILGGYYVRLSQISYAAAGSADRFYEAAMLTIFPPHTDPRILLDYGDRGGPTAISLACRYVYDESSGQSTGHQMTFWTDLFGATAADVTGWGFNYAQLMNTGYSLMRAAGGFPVPAENAQPGETPSGLRRATAAAVSSGNI